MNDKEVTEIVEKRQKEYGDWLWANLGNLMYSTPMTDPPSWALSSRKPPTYGDVVRRKV